MAWNVTIEQAVPLPRILQVSISNFFSATAYPA
jgi:hypothetical protein